MNMVVVDTNVLLRFFLQDNEAQFQKAKQLLTHEKHIFIPESVCAELVYVLEKVYGYPRLSVLEVFTVLLSSTCIQVPEVIAHAVQLYAKSSVALVDCLAASHARQGTLATFDKKLLHQTKVQPYWNLE